MKKTRSFLLIFLLFCMSCSKNDDDFPLNNNCLTGLGIIVSETRSVSNFHSINSTIEADILLTQGPREDLIIEAQQNILQVLKTEVVNGELRLSTNQCVDLLQRVKVIITIPNIKKLMLTGEGNIIAQNDFNLANLNVILTGVGDIILKGETFTFDILLNGVGNVKSFNFHADTCEVTLTGVGDAEVFVNDELKVTLTGVGNVYYKGQPSITANITGAGSIIDAN